MSDAQVSFWLIAMGVVDLIAVIVATLVLFTSDSPLAIMQKVGVAFLVLGLVVQLARSSHYLVHGFYPVDVYFPLWITKDIGAAVLIYYYSFIKIKGAA